MNIMTMINAFIVTPYFNLCNRRNLWIYSLLFLSSRFKSSIPDKTIEYHCFTLQISPLLIVPFVGS